MSSKGHDNEMGHIRDRRNGKWWWCHNAIIDQYGPTLGPHGIAVYTALCRYASDTATCWPSVATIAHDTGMSTNRVRQSLADLEKARLIDIEHRSKNKLNIPSIYTLLEVVEYFTTDSTSSGEVLHHVKQGTSPDEVGVLHHVKQGTSPREDNKDSLKKTQLDKDPEIKVAADAAPPSEPSFPDTPPPPTEKRKPTQQQAEVGAWGDVMELDITVKANAKRVGNMLTGLRQSKVCAPSAEVAITRFGRVPPPDGTWNYYTHSWQGAKEQPPTEREINQYWGAWLKPALKVVSSNGFAPTPVPADPVDDVRKLSQAEREAMRLKVQTDHRQETRHGSP